MKVKAGLVYRYNPCMWDIMDKRTDLEKGDLVKVKNIPGCPPANTMGHCHVVNPDTEEFIGLVHCNSLEEI